MLLCQFLTKILKIDDFPCLWQPSLKATPFFKDVKYTHQHLKSPLEVKYLQKKYLVFVNSKIGVIFGGHLGNGGHIEKLRDGSIAYFNQ